MRRLYGLIERMHSLAAAVVLGAARGLLSAQSALALRIRLSFGFALLAGIALWLGLASPHWIAVRVALLGMPDELLGRFDSSGWPAEYAHFRMCAVGVAAACWLAAALLVWIRRRLAHWLARWIACGFLEYALFPGDAVNCDPNLTRAYFQDHLRLNPRSELAAEWLAKHGS